MPGGGGGQRNQEPPKWHQESKPGLGCRPSAWALAHDLASTWTWAGQQDKQREESGSQKQGAQADFSLTPAPSSPPGTAAPPWSIRAVLGSLSHDICPPPPPLPKAALQPVGGPVCSPRRWEPWRAASRKIFSGTLWSTLLASQGVLVPGDASSQATWSPRPFHHLPCLLHPLQDRSRGAALDLRRGCDCGEVGSGALRAGVLGSPLVPALYG